MNKYYVLEHLNVLNGYCGNGKMIGVYSSRRAAEEAVGRLADKPGFRDAPEIRDPGDIIDGFRIIECELDGDNWMHGFDVVPEDAPEHLKMIASCRSIDVRE